MAPWVRPVLANGIILVGLLQPGMEQLGKAGSSPYLPYASLVDFEKLAQDWVNLADCNMPSYDAVPHLVTITGLHMLLYFLRRSCDVLDFSAYFCIRNRFPKTSC